MPKGTNKKGPAQVHTSHVPLGAISTPEEQRASGKKVAGAGAAAKVSVDSPFAEQSAVVGGATAKAKQRKNLGAPAHQTSNRSPFYQGPDGEDAVRPAKPTRRFKSSEDNTLVDPTSPEAQSSPKRRVLGSGPGVSKTYSSTLDLQHPQPPAPARPPKRTWSTSEQPLESSKPSQRFTSHNKKTSKTFASSSDNALGGPVEPAPLPQRSSNTYNTSRDHPLSSEPTPERKPARNSATFASSSDSPFNAPPEAIQEEAPRQKGRPKGGIPDRLAGKPAGASNKPHLLNRKPARSGQTFAPTQPFATQGDTAPPRMPSPRKAPSNPNKVLLGGDAEQPVRGRNTKQSGKMAGRNTGAALGLTSEAPPADAVGSRSKGRRSTGNRSNLSHGLW